MHTWVGWYEYQWRHHIKVVVVFVWIFSTTPLIKELLEKLKISRVSKLLDIFANLIIIDEVGRESKVLACVSALETVFGITDVGGIQEIVGECSPIVVYRTFDKLRNTRLETRAVRQWTESASVDKTGFLRNSSEVRRYSVAFIGNYITRAIVDLA